MAKAVAFAVCILTLATTFAYCQAQKLSVEGQVYCDPCRVQFQTKLSDPISGATVRVECRNNEDSKNITYSVEAVTDNKGHYSLPIEGEHDEEEICEVMVVKSPRTDCNVPFEYFEKARISCTENDGVKGAIRLANPLGFMTKKPAPECKKILEELDLLPLD